MSPCPAVHVFACGKELIFFLSSIHYSSFGARVSQSSIWEVLWSHSDQQGKRRCPPELRGSLSFSGSLVLQDRPEPIWERNLGVWAKAPVAESPPAFPVSPKPQANDHTRFPTYEFLPGCSWQLGLVFCSWPMENLTEEELPAPRSNAGRAEVQLSHQECGDHMRCLLGS